jgi:hypothetical protein
MNVSGLRSAILFAALSQVGLCASIQAPPNASSISASHVPASGAAASKGEITRDEIEAQVRFLASDELLGRMTGTKEGERAARYLAQVLEREGVEPAGDDHTFLQAVPLEHTRTTAPTEVKGTDRKGESVTFVAGRDFSFSGPAIDAKDLRVIVAAKDADLPKSADSAVALFLDASLPRGRQWLDQAGLGRGDGFGLLIYAGSTKPGEDEVAPSSWGTPMRTGTGSKRRTLRANAGLLERIRKGELATLSVTSHVESESLTSHNVVGRISGRGTREHPELASQAIVISAHYDHLGEAHSHANESSTTDAHKAPAESSTASPGGVAPVEDRIYNGADDDASGCAAVLEIAGAFAAGPKPARTLIFLLATGEEIGLLGTREYLEHPVIALDHTIANLNFEMIGRPDPLVGGSGVMWLTGYDRTNLGPAFEAANLPVKPDRRPEQHFFERSDNYAFADLGIVGQTFSTFNLHSDYHRVTDEADRLDYAHMEACVRSGYRAVKMVADGTIDPLWVEGKTPAGRR